MLRGNVPKRGRSRPATRYSEAPDLTRALIAAACRNTPRKATTKQEKQRESARSTVFFNTNLTTTKNDAPVH